MLPLDDAKVTKLFFYNSAEHAWTDVTVIVTVSQTVSELHTMVSI